MRKEDGKLALVYATELTDHRLLDGLVGFNLAVARELPRIVLRFAEVDGRMVCVNIEIGADFDRDDELDPEPITTEILRRIPLARLIEETLGQAVRGYEAASEWEGGIAERAKERLPAVRAGSEGRKRPGRPRLYGDEHFAEVANIYRSHSGGRSPTKAVEDHFKVNKSTAAKWVARAREIGLLEPYGGRAPAEIRQSPKRRQTRRAT
jgi:hypothetical protein